MLEEKIHNLIQSRINQLGYDLLRVKYFDNTSILQIMIDTKDENTRIGIDDCAKVSREISVILDVEDLIYKRYNLEVTSPGINRPLLKIDDFIKYKGFQAKLLLKEMINGIRRCKGTIAAINDDTILFQLQDSQMLEIPFTVIDSANLILNEEILKNKQVK